MVPPDLIPIVGKKELRFSLKTGDKRVATQRAQVLKKRVRKAYNRISWSKTEACFMVDQGTLTRTEINKLIREYIIKGLDEFDQQQAEGRPGNSDTVDDDIDGFWAALLESRMALAERRHVKFMSFHVDLFLDEMGLSLDKESDEYKRLCREFLKANIRIMEANRSKLTGHFEDTDPIAVMRDLGVTPEIPAQVQQPQTEPADQGPSIKMSELIDEYQVRKLESKRWTQGTVRNHRPKMNALIQFVGNRPVNTVSVDDMRQFAKVLELLPPGFARLPKYKDISGLLPDALEGEHKKKLDPTTRREYLNFAKSVFAHAVENQYIDANPVISGIIPQKKKHARRQRDAFSVVDLRNIFDPETYLNWSKGKPERFYVPLLLLYTGCRLEEVASLYCVDLFEKGGLWCIDIIDERDRKIKNEIAVRSIPLHPVLVQEFRFPDYVLSLKDERIFPTLKTANFKYGHEFSKRFGYYLRKKVGITSPKKTLHCFRHNVTDQLYKDLVMESLIEELPGRAGKTETRQRYAKGYRAKTLYEECILKLDYEIDLSGLTIKV